MEHEIKIPDIGSSQAVDVIEILVTPGQTIAVDTPLITLESDKASMEIPSPQAGIIEAIAVKIGDKVQQGDLILTLVSADDTSPSPLSEVSEQTIEAVKIPDIGTENAVSVIEIMVQPGDEIAENAALITLESDKASMEIPSPKAGKIQSIALKLGDQVKQGDLILTLATAKNSATTAPPPVVTAPPAAIPAPPAQVQSQPKSMDNAPAHELSAGPAVRRLARTLGVDLNAVQGSGRKSRITIEDVEAYIKQRLQAPTEAQTGLVLPQAPAIDFAQYGPIETQALTKIKRLSGQNLHKAWLQIPHVTQFDQADITELEEFRQQQSALLAKDGVKLTILAFICKAVTRALQEFPDFNASLSSDGQTLIVKKYYHIGIAVDTPAGLVVPVIKNAEQLSIRELAITMAELGQKARKKALTPADMSGASFTISSLGGIGGTAFTPIVNAPEVAILGVSRASIQAMFQQGKFVPRLMLPLSLSYDHRVIDGAQGARFTKYLAGLLSDIRTVML